MKNREQGAGNQMRPLPAGEQGYMLLGLIVAIALILLALSVAASDVAFKLRREREVESARRADQYVRAIRKFYLKNQHYPGSMEQLDNTNMVRYLRKHYVDPLTGKSNWRLIAPGQNKTTVKGFFGQPLAGIASSGLGAVAGMQSPGVPGPTAGGASSFGAAGGIGGASSFGGAGGIGGAAGGAAGTTVTTGAGAAGAAGAGAGAAGQPGATDSGGGAGTSGLGSVAGMASPMGTGLPGSSGPFMGIGSSATGNSILVVNEQTTYETWEFLYDPRIEKLKQAAALNAGASSVGAGSLGQTPGSIGNSNAPGAGNSPTNSPTSFGPTGFGGGAAPGGTAPTPQP
jgi:type II secretory pathway pseudopilin PulG